MGGRGGPFFNPILICTNEQIILPRVTARCRDIVKDLACIESCFIIIQETMRIFLEAVGRNSTLAQELLQPGNAEVQVSIFSVITTLR